MLKKSLELRSLVADLIWCYTIGHVNVDIGDSLSVHSHLPVDMIRNYIKVTPSVLV